MGGTKSKISVAMETLNGLLSSLNFRELISSEGFFLFYIIGIQVCISIEIRENGISVTVKVSNEFYLNSPFIFYEFLNPNE